MICPNCGKDNDDRAMYCQACGISLQARPAPTPVVAAYTGFYAGFWTRFLALIIDAIIISVASGIVAAGTMGAGVVVSFFGPWLYEAFMLSSEWQATVGKRAMSIVVTGIDGKRIGIHPRHWFHYGGLHGKEAGSARHDCRDVGREPISGKLP